MSAVAGARGLQPLCRASLPAGLLSLLASPHRALHATAAAEYAAPASQPEQPGQPAALPGLGEALPHLTRTGCIYLDYNATTPIYPEVAREMAPFLFEHFGNPSSGHTYGRACKAAMDTARARVAALISAHPDEVHFTSCGTESDNWAVYGAVMAWRAARRATHGSLADADAQHELPHVVTSAVEHPAVLVHLQHLADQGLLTYTAVPADAQGLVEPAAVAAAVTPATALVTVMHSNNEVGAVQPIAEIARAARAAAARRRGEEEEAGDGAGVVEGSGGGGEEGTGRGRGKRRPPRLLVHTDAAQSAGKVELDVGALGVDALTLVGHKFGAPKGVAALYIRRGVSLPSYFHGGGQEGGRRAGTEAVLQAVGLGAAAALAAREGAAARAHQAAMAGRLRGALWAGVRPEDLPKLRLHGPPDPARRLPNTLSIAIRGLDSAAALARLAPRLAASAGAACHSGGAGAGAGAGPRVSAVLRAMQVPVEYAAGTLRLSTGRHTTAGEVDAAAGLILAEARRQGVIG